MLKYLMLLMLLCCMGAAPLATFRVVKGTISFKSDAPLEMIKATSDELSGLFDADKKMFAFRIKVNSFKGFNGALQKEHFNENYMETTLHPYADFQGKLIEDLDYRQPGNYTVRAKGNLTIHGVVQERIIKVDLTIKDKLILAKSNFTVLLADHNITIPKVVHEKLASEIRVDLKAELAAP